MPICRYGNRLDRINHMIGVEPGKNPIPVFPVGNIVAFAQSRQISLALNNKTTSLITAVRRLQHEAISLPAVINQLSTNERHAIFPDHLVNMAGAAG